MHKKSSPLSWRNSKENLKLIGNLNAKGVVESFTIVHSAPSGFERNVPYILALINLGNGEKITAQVVDCKNISIGSKVEPCIRRVAPDDENGIISYCTKFRAVK